MDVIHNPAVVPDMPAIEGSMMGKARERWRSLTAYIEGTYKSLP